MKHFLLLYLSTLFLSDISGQTVMGRQTAEQFPINNTGGQVYGLTWLPQTYNNTTRRYPLIIFLHGTGETGTTVSNLSKLYTASPRSIAGRIADGWNATAINPLTGLQDSFIVVSPQAATWSLNYTELKHILPNILSRYRVDTTRIYLTGLSAGGGGVFSTFGSRDSNFIKKFAAMATASSAGTNASNGYTAEQVEAGLRFGSSYGVRMWTIAGDQDYLLSTDVRYHDSTNMLNPTRPNKLTVIAGVGHSAWGRTFDPAFRPVAGFYGKNGTCTNGCTNGGIPVVPNANGSSITGSGITQDSLNLYEWLLLSKRNTTAATMVITANAGTTHTVTLPLTSVTLNGTATAGTGYTINSYTWTKIAGPAQFTIVNPGQAQTVVNNLTQGTYQFVLTVTDNSGASSSDTVTVVVNAAANQPPVAIAGSNQLITFPINITTLAGSGTDADGSITSYQWTKIAGPTQFTIATATLPTTLVSNLLQGTYQFALTVTDNSGASASDTVTVGINAASNQLPVASAGSNQSVTLPINTVTLTGSGTDADGTIATYQWTKIAGPAQFTVVNPGQAQTVVNNLTQGTYQFALTVTDNGGDSASDTVTVVVNAASNQLPVASAGSNQSVTLPINNVTLTGSGTDADGTIATYQWTKIAGPAQFTVVNPDQAQTVVNNLTQGTYQFVLTITDNSGDSASDTVTVVVNAASNQLPVASAGSNQSVTLPINTVTLTGSGTDADGTIATYQWTKIAGPAQFTVVNPDQAQTVVNNLTQGTYQFVLTITDNSGDSASDTVTVVVNAASNQLPVASAGSNQSVTLPINTVTLTGSGTDADGTIATYQWTKIAGPAQFTVVNPGQAQTVVNNLTQGTYQFVLTITDNSGASTSDTVSITVNPSAATPCGGRSYTVLPVGDGGYYNSLNLQPGDTLFLDAQYTYYYVYLANRHGTPSCPIVVMNKGGQVKIQGGHLSQISLYNCSYIKVIGTGSPTDTYGFRIRPYAADSLINGSFAFSVTGRSKNIEVSNLHISNAGTGMNIKEDGGCDPQYNFPNWVMDSINIHDNKIVKTWNQGMYVGNTSPDNGPTSYSPRPVNCSGNITYPRPPRMGNIKIYNNIVDSTGRAGIQLASASTGISEIYNNTVKHSGMGGDGAQGAGIIVGSYTKAYVHHNTITNTFAWGLASSGASGTNIPLRFENNIIDSSGFLNSWILWTAGKSNIRISTEPIVANTITWAYSIFVATKPTLDKDSTQFWIKSNSLGRRKHPTGGIGLADYVVSFQKNGNYICNNINSYGGTPLVVREEVTPVLYNTNCTDNQNWLPVAYAGNDQTIILPINSVTLSGSGTDADGTIASYQWTKIAGPTQFTIVAASQAQTAVNNLIQGTYRFELKVTDNLGATGVDTITVTVNPTPPPNQAPVANAGSDRTITLPVNTVTVSGAGTDADGTIASYQWTKIAGPTQFTIVAASQAQTAINNLAQGTYRFELRVADNLGAVGRDTVTIIVNAAIPVNQAPVANAGSDHVITLPLNTVTLTGSGTDADGTIATYQWTKIAGPTQFTILSATQAQATANSLLQGIYQFELRVTDNLGASGRDTVIVTVNLPAAPPNQAPVANAGADQTITLPINTVTLSGAGTDADGIIASYQWTKIAGPTQFTIVSPTHALTAVNNLVQGTYRFELRIADNLGAVARDTVTIIVNAAIPVNQAPIANAGSDQTITLPINTVTLSGAGTDADGTIASYQWTKIAGPTQFTIVSAAQAQTAVNNLAQGTYRFELRVADNLGAVGRDTVTIVVNAAIPVNQAPVANAGSNQIVTLPVNTVTLSGAGSDADGTIASYQWTKIAGPTQFVLLSATQAQATVNSLSQGIYQFELRVTDNLGAVGRDTVFVSVNQPAPPPNQPPVALAGTDRNITLPLNSVTLSGSATDADGFIASYLWTKIAGPAQFIVISQSQPQTQVNNLAQGVYKFELRVTDNQGAIGRDTVTVTVNSFVPAVNQLPIADAGLDHIITLPDNSVTLSGSGSDPDGVIASYQWSKVSGPDTFSVVPMSQTKIVVSNLVEGEYHFLLTVTDNLGAVGKDTVTIKVNKSSQKQAGVKIYPNPATSIINVELNGVQNPAKAILRILNLEGKVVYQTEITRTQTILVVPITVQHFNAGVYYVHISGDATTGNPQSFIKL